MILANTITIQKITPKTFSKITPVARESVARESIDVANYGRQFLRRTVNKVNFPNPLHKPHLCNFRHGEFGIQVNSQAMPVFNHESAVRLDIAHRPFSSCVEVRASGALPSVLCPPGQYLSRPRQRRRPMSFRRRAFAPPIVAAGCRRLCS